MPDGGCLTLFVPSQKCGSFTLKGEVNIVLAEGCGQRLKISGDARPAGGGEAQRGPRHRLGLQVPGCSAADTVLHRKLYFINLFSGPTCTIPVRNDLTTLDLTVQQIEHLNRTYDTDVPLVLMNSFLTEEDTARLVRKYSSLRVTIHTFTQSRYPR